MATESGWRPLRSPSTGGPNRPGASPFARLAIAHAVLIAGDTLVTLALAGTLFFSISPADAKPRVALYLVLTMAPLAVAAPLIGPALDRTLGARRWIVAGSAAGRALACIFMAADIQSLLLFPEAFCVLVLSKAHTVAKSAMVPGVVTHDDELVEANSKLALAAVAAGVVAAIPGVIVLQLLDAAWVLRLAVLVFAAGTVAAARIPAGVADPSSLPPEAKAELRALGIVLAAAGMGLLRAVVGFLTFLVAFAFRRTGAPSWWFGVVLAASMAGTLVGNVAAPRLRDRVREEVILAGALAAVAVGGVLAALGSSRTWIAILAATVGAAASAGKLAFDSLVQRDAPDAAHGRSFARFETRFQLLWVAGAFIPVVVPIPGWVGALIIAATGGFGAFTYLGGLRAAARRRGVVGPS